MLEVLNPLRGEIRLLGRVYDQVIENRSDREVFLLIPDLHLISAGRQERFGRYGFNHSLPAGQTGESGLLLELLKKMVLLKTSFESGNNKLITIQLGDFFDMWREFPGIARPEEIQDVHNELRDILYRGRYRGKPCLKATMILGNHDTKNGVPLQEIPFELKTFNRTGDGRPFLFVTHGDAFDIIETMLPDPVEEFAVYFAGDLTPINKYPVGKWGKYAGDINKPLGSLNQAITEPEHILNNVTGALKVSPGQALPSHLCYEVTSTDETGHGLFRKIYDSIDKATERDLPGQHIRITAIGHTHKACMILCRPVNGGRPLVLMDIGAWIEKCSYPLAENGETVTEPSAQLGVIHGNDARIYQIRMPGGV